ERSRRIESPLRPPIRVLRTVQATQVLPVARARIAPPAWIQRPAMLVVRTAAGSGPGPAPASPLPGAITDGRAAPITAPSRPAELASGDLPLGRRQIERLTEEVMRGIDRRFVALRERLGRG